MILLTIGTGTTILGGHVLTRPQNVLNQISKEKRSLLNLEEIKEEKKDTYKEKADWEKILKKEGSSINEKVKSFASLDDSTESEDYKKVNKIKGKCKEKLKVLYSDPGFWSAVEEVRQFCIKAESE